MLQINTLTRLDLGVMGENNARNLQVDMNTWITDHPNGTFSIWHKRSGDQTKYAAGGVAFDRETGILTWTPTSYDTFYQGQGTAEIRCTENGVIKKSKDIITETARSLMSGSGETLVPGWQSLLNAVCAAQNGAEQAQGAAENAQEAAEAAAENIEEYAREAEDSAEAAAGRASDAALSATQAGNAQAAAETAKGAAEAAAAAAESAVAHYPYVDPVTGDWMVWDADDEQFVDTGIHAEGTKGNTGAVPNIAVGTVTTLPPGKQATVVRRSGSPDTAPIFDFGIPKGDTGQADNIYGTTLPMSPTDNKKVATAIGDKLDSSAAATAYDQTATYDVGDKCSFNGKIYQCTTAISTPEAFNNLHWTEEDTLVEQIDGKAAQSNALTLTAAANAWSQGEQTISAPGVTASGNILVGAGIMTASQREAFIAAGVACTAQGSGTITLTCYGTVPVIDLPITVIILG